MAWTVPTTEQKNVWKKEVWYEAGRRLYWSKFMGKGEDSVIQTFTDLQKNPGDLIYVPLLTRLTGAGFDETDGLASTEGADAVYAARGSTTITESSRLMGYDGSSSYALADSLTYYNDSVPIAQKRNYVRSPGAYFHQQHGFDFNSHCNKALSTWIAEYIDKCMFMHMCGNSSWSWPTSALAPSSSGTEKSNRVIYGGNATSKGTITAGDYFTTEEIDRARHLAKIAEPRIMPIRAEDGKEYYTMIIHPRQAYTLRNDGNWSDAQQYAGPRTEKNNIFTGALGIWNGVVIHEHEWVFTGSDAGSGSDLGYANAVFLGKQAGVFAKCKEISYEVDTTSSDADFGDKPAISVGFMGGMKKTRFNSIDYATITVQTYASSPSGSDHAV